MIEPKTFAASTLQLLQEDPRRYRMFGVYWYLVKEMLKRFYTQDNLHLLGSFSDPTVIERMPPLESLQDALSKIVEEYRQNASFNLGRQMVTAPDGEVFALYDQDAGI